jgi:hypothetical protein
VMSYAFIVLFIVVLISTYFRERAIARQTIAEPMDPSGRARSNIEQIRAGLELKAGVPEHHPPRRNNDR